MRSLKYFVIGVLVLLGGLSGVAWATEDCPNGLTLKRVGVVGVPGNNLQSGLISSGAQNIKKITWQCTSSACSGAVYNATDTATGSTAVLDIGAAASGGGSFDFDSPLRFDTAVSVAGTNVAGVSVYACQAP